MNAAAGAIIPWWISVPLAGLVMAVLIAHLVALQGPEVPASRRRIRTASGLLMFVLAPLMAYAVSIAGPQSPRAMTMAWLAVLLLLVMVVGLAWLDVANNLRLARLARRELQEEAARALAEDLRGAGSRRA